jgi:hypothetical protein
MFDALPNGQRARAQEVDFRILLDDEPRSPVEYLHPQTKRPQIDITTGFARMMQMYSDGQIRFGTLKPMLFAEYLVYATNQSLENEIRRQQSAQPPRFIKSLTQFTREKLTPAEFQSFEPSPEQKCIVMASYELTLAFIMAHEIGHHVLRHDEDHAVDLATRRKREEEADEWAVKTLVRAGIPPIGGYTAMIYFFVTNKVLNEDAPPDVRLAMKERFTHPTELSRLESLTKITRDSLDTLGRNMREDWHLLGSTRAQIANAIDQLDTYLTSLFEADN